MTLSPQGSPGGLTSTQPPLPDDPTLRAGKRCDLCRGIALIPRPDGLIELLACLAHTGMLHRAGNVAAGLDPDADEQEREPRVGPEHPALAGLYPPDGLHVHMTLPMVTAAAVARILAVAPAR